MISKARNVRQLLSRYNLQPLPEFSIGRRFLGTNSSEKISDHVIFSGIQPTGVPHLGNYLGALQQWVKLQNSSSPTTKLLYSIVDLHAYTVPQDSKKLEQFGREALATLLAIGLDPKRSIIFYQSSVGLNPLRSFQTNENFRFQLT
jgi:tryptophanyl-tRNA synthetase